MDGAGAAPGSRLRLAPGRSVLHGAGGREGARISPSGWAIWIYAVVFPIYLAYTWWTTAIALRGVAAIAPYVLLVPIVGGLFALIWLGETVGLASAAGAALTLLGLAQSRGWLPRRRRRPACA